MSQPVFLMIEATPNPNEKEALQSYLSQAPVVTKEYGGVPIATYDVETAIDHGEKPGVFVVMSFPSRDAIKSLFSDPAYEALIPLRDLGFSQIRYFIVNERV